MYLFQTLLFVAAVVLLVVGYRRTHRNLMLAAAIVLFFSVAVDDVVEGFRAGYCANSEHGCPARVTE